MKNEKMTENIVFKIDTEMHEKLKEIAREEERTIASLIRIILKKYLDKLKTED